MKMSSENEIPTASFSLTKSLGKGKFFSSSDSEGEDDQLKKFKIKIKPKESTEIIPPSMEELKASIGNIALSPALMVSPCDNCIFPSTQLSFYSDLLKSGLGSHGVILLSSLHDLVIYAL